MSKDIRALLHTYADAAKRESDTKKQQKATAKELAEYKRIITKLKDYKKEKRIASFEDFQNISFFISKMSNEQKIAIEELPAMPPGPLPLIHELSKNVSCELFEAKKNFDEKSITYYELVNVYFSGKKVNPKKLWLLYDESMNLYNNYVELNNKESESSKD